MVERVTVYQSLGGSIYAHLAEEELLMRAVAADELIVYLWCNAPCVVIGQNQNPWRECNLTAMEAAHVQLARRKTGGGAVYQDMGNLNFSFIAKGQNYDQAAQTQLLIEALRDMGVEAQVDGRNDLLLADGRKCSGMAFCERGDACLQHGTLLVSVDLADMAKYLQVSEAKLQSKGVRSVRSRVANISEIKPSLTVQQAVETLIRKIHEQYTCFVEMGDLAVRLADVDDGHSTETGLEAAGDERTTASLRQLKETYASWTWNYGRRMPFTYRCEYRYDWGEVQYQFQVDRGIITDVQIDTDALDPDKANQLRTQLIGKHFRGSDPIKFL